MPNASSRRQPLAWSEAIKSDLPASIIVFLVALPLCMGIAIASGAPPASGLITGIVGGLLVGFLAGSPLQVSGPAAGLFVLVLEIIEKYKHAAGPESEVDMNRALAAMGLAVLGAGFIQLAAGALRLGSLFRAVSPSVIQGMLSGIGVLILASQFHVMVDDKNAAADWRAMGLNQGVANLLSIPDSLLKGVVPLDGSPHHLAAAIGVGTILVLVFWKSIPIKALRVLPAPVVAVTLAAVVAYQLDITLPPAELEALEDAQNVPEEGRVKITQVEVPNNLTDDIRLPTWSQTRELMSWSLVLSMLTIAMVASAETMLCATAVDQMQNHARTNYDRELAAQGVGNIVCGALGALPMTGVIVRSSANVDAGGRTRLSAILHGLWLLVFVVALPWVLNYIPMAALAAVLVFTGWKLINPLAIRKLFRASFADGAICVITLALVVAVDLLTGVLTGIACTAAWLLYTFARLDARVEPAAQGNRLDLHLKGAATFLALPKLTALLDEIDPSSELHVHLEELTYVDHACLELLVNWEKQHEAAGGRLVIDWENLTATFKSAGASRMTSPASTPQPAEQEAAGN